MRTSHPSVDLPKGTKLAWHQVLDSTNEEARRRARAGERGPLWIVAETQTQGRGRQGRLWTSGAGNLAATLLLVPPGPPERMALLSFVAALAVVEVVAGCGVAAEVKWPNDVLVRRRKIAGILLESATSSDPGAPPWIAIGVGLNLAHSPAGTEFPATSLVAEGGAALTQATALTRLAQAFAVWQERYRAQGFAPVREAWLQRAAGLGEPLRVRLSGAILSGTFLGLGEDGTLRLGLAGGGERAIAAGDVFFPETGAGEV